ncbi:hypothetical protein HY385_02780 [Candidatus Daviesbacteria bacterium]|nr:hypothetical protein [Candidatus Daviesbacteria bacterium]
MAEIKTGNPFPTIEEVIEGAVKALEESYEPSNRPKNVSERVSKNLIKPFSFVRRLKSDLLDFWCSIPGLAQVYLMSGVFSATTGSLMITKAADDIGMRNFGYGTTFASVLLLTNTIAYLAGRKS